ncbi:MAG: DUF192 domain-containing protein [Parcubacteria group bacterium]
MKKNTLIIFLAAVIVIASVFWLLIREKMVAPQFSEAENSIKEIKINDYNFLAEVVDNSEKRALGLSGRPELCPECAMLFVFEKPNQVSFWMKDMQFDLDIIWIASDEIENISKNVSHAQGSAEVVQAPGPVDKVLEINAGISEKLDLKIGDKVEFSNFSKAKP